MNRFLTLLPLAAYATALAGCGGSTVTVAADVAGSANAGTSGVSDSSLPHGAGSSAGGNGSQGFVPGGPLQLAGSGGTSSGFNPGGPLQLAGSGGTISGFNPGGPEIPADAGASTSDSNPGGPEQPSAPSLCGTTCDSATQYCANLTGYKLYQCYPLPTPCIAQPTCSCLQENDSNATNGSCTETANGLSIMIPWN